MWFFSSASFDACTNKINCSLKRPSESIAFKLLVLTRPHKSIWWKDSDGKKIVSDQEPTLRTNVHFWCTGELGVLQSIVWPWILIADDWLWREIPGEGLVAGLERLKNIFNIEASRNIKRTIKIEAHQQNLKLNWNSSQSEKNHKKRNNLFSFYNLIHHFIEQFIEWNCSSSCSKLCFTQFFIIFFSLLIPLASVAIMNIIK